MICLLIYYKILQVFSFFCLKLYKRNNIKIYYGVKNENMLRNNVDFLIGKKHMVDGESYDSQDS